MSDGLDSFFASKRKGKDKKKGKKPVGPKDEGKPNAAPAADEEAKKQLATEDPEEDEVEDENLTKLNIGDKIKVKSTAEVQAQREDDQKVNLFEKGTALKEQQQQPKEEPTQDSLKKCDGASMNFTGQKPTFGKANAGKAMKMGDFPDLDMAAQAKEPKKAPKETFKAIGKDAPQVYQQAAPVAEFMRGSVNQSADTSDIKFGAKKTFTSNKGASKKKEDEASGFAPVNTEIYEQNQKRMAEKMAQDQEEKDQNRVRALERRERLERGEAELEEAKRPEPVPEPIQKEEVTQIIRGSGKPRGHQAPAKAEPKKEAGEEDEEGFQAVAEKKRTGLNFAGGKPSFSRGGQKSDAPVARNTGEEENAGKPKGRFVNFE